MMAVEWTIDLVARLKDLLAAPDKPSALDIGKRLGISRNAVIGKCRRLKLLLPNNAQTGLIWAPEKDRALGNYWFNGYSAREIVDHIPGTTLHTVHSRIYRLGLNLQARKTRKPPRRSDSAKLKPNGISRQRLTNRGTRFTMETVTEYEQPAMTAGGIEPLNIALLDLTSGQCRWPYGDEAPYFFCGHPQDYASSYCPFHADMASSRGTPGERSVAPYIPPRRRAA